MSSSGWAAANELLPVFESLLKQESILTLSNTYQGMMWYLDSRILSVNPDYAVVKVKDCKSFISPGKQIQLHSIAFSRPVKATLQDLNYDDGLLYLSGIAYSDRDWQPRYHERVEPKDPAYAILTFNRRQYRACIENISMNGQGLLIDKRYFKGSRIKLLSKIVLKFKLPPGYEWNTLKGSVVNLNTINDSLVRLGIRLHPNAQESRSLINYVANRKQEILDELDQNCFDKIVLHGVERLYF